MSSDPLKFCFCDNCSYKTNCETFVCDDDFLFYTYLYK